MKILIKSVFLSVIAKIIICKSLIHPFQFSEDLSVISRVLDDVAQEFLKKEKLRFDLYYTPQIPHFSFELLNLFLSKSDRKLTV